MLQESMDLDSTIIMSKQLGRNVWLDSRSEGNDDDVELWVYGLEFGSRSEGRAPVYESSRTGAVCAREDASDSVVKGWIVLFVRLLSCQKPIESHVCPDHHRRRENLGTR